MVASAPEPVPEGGAASSGRHERRRARTRQALIGAARQFLAEHGSLNVSIQQLTDAADVGFGSFYNHFSSKRELERAAITDVLEAHGRMLDERTAHLADPAEVFATSLRLTMRLVDTDPQTAQILVRTGFTYVMDETSGIYPRALRDIKRAMSAGRFPVQDTDIMLAATGGALLAMVQLTLRDRGRVDGSSIELLTMQLLRGFGMPSRSARAVAFRPLPD
ncbi:MAG: TetR/AcrR family transcriptional regulator [Dermatophilaceae bacterium]